LRRYFRYTFAPRELYLHTIVFNSPFAQKTPRGGLETDVRSLGELCDMHLIHYYEVGKIYTAADFDEIIASPKLFCRKLTPSVSGELYDRLNATFVEPG
jgi:hypothetical protein